MERMTKLPSAASSQLIAPSTKKVKARAAADTAAAARHQAQNARARIEWLFSNLAEADYIGEPVSVLQHSWQAYSLAKEAGETEDLQMAALLHDIGHILSMEAGFGPGMDGCGAIDHEGIGADLLRSLGFSEDCCLLVGHHVNAKRYLVSQYKDYELTEASRITLSFQGGPMEDDEAAVFEKLPLFKSILRMRTYDERAKVANVGDVPPSAIGQLVEAHVFKNLLSLDRHPPHAEEGSSSSSSPQYMLSKEQLRFFGENGFLLVRGHNGITSTDLHAAAQDLAALLEASDFPWLVDHGEVASEAAQTQGEAAKVLPARGESFVKHHDVWAKVARHAGQIASQLFRDHANLFVDKIRSKIPNKDDCQVYHQDVRAYSTGNAAQPHISVMIAVKEVDCDSLGLLQVARRDRPHVNLTIIPNNEGVIIHPNVEPKMDLLTVSVKPGDLLFFSSYVPHRSYANQPQARSRNAVFLSFSPAHEGSHSAEYYVTTRHGFETGTGNAGTVTMNDDFNGNVVKSPKHTSRL